MDKTKKAKSIPTPIATPVGHIKGILEAKYLNPNNTKAKNKKQYLYLGKKKIY